MQVYTDGRPNISTHGRKATIKDFYGMQIVYLLFTYVLKKKNNKVSNFQIMHIL